MKESFIQIENLAKRFNSTPALKEINLRIQRGEIFGIIGMSGAGKSTLIRCLAGLEKPSEGHIFLEREDLATLSGKELRAVRKKMGMIFQHFNLFSSRTASENIAYPLEIEGISRKSRLARARELLELVGLKGKGDYYPAQLSGGEKQRVAIARALVRSPALLLCDEATSSLDPHATHSILELLSQLNRKLGLTIVLITHEMEVIKQICTRVAVLEHGEVVEEGATLTLFSSPKHPTTKRFLQNLTHILPEHLLPKGENQDLLRLSFTGKNASQPIISRLIREYQVEVNILLGSIDVLHTGTVGNLVIALSGPKEERLKGCQFLESCGVKWERIE
jgi:D-methionine transport system ATP-binding protein